jgi:hypothetical protein
MESKILKNTAKIVSWIFHPFLVPIWGFLLLMNFIPGSEFYDDKLKYFLYAIVFVSTCVFPLMFVLVLSFNPSYNRKMEHPRDRILPYFFTAISAFFGSQLMARLSIPGIFRVFLLGTCLVLVILFMVTFVWKISAHAAGVGGLIGSMLALTFRLGMDLTWIIILLFLIAGVVGSSRIYLEKHTPAQVYAGFAVSLSGMFFMVFLI